MFLQTPTQVVNTATEKHVFSLWEILFSGGIIGNTIMIAIFLTGILALYIFLERYFFIKRASKETPNFLENIKDFPSNKDLARLHYLVQKQVRCHKDRHPHHRKGRHWCKFPHWNH
jgi:biopolymer transport protein ExbB/TolQ